MMPSLLLLLLLMMMMMTAGALPIESSEGTNHGPAE